MNKRLFAVLAVLVLMVCALPMVVGAATENCNHSDDATFTRLVETKTAPTCSQPGLGRYLCTYCTMGKEKEIPATGNHTPISVPGYAATCYKSGLTDGTMCDVCKTTLTNQDTIPQRNHDWDNAVWSENTAGDCQTLKTYDVKCGYSDCGMTKHDQTNGTYGSHNIEIDEAIPATCTENGLTAGEHCTVDGCTHKVEQEVDPKTGHNWDYEHPIWKDGIAPTCTDGAIASYSCLNGCNYKNTNNPVDALGHTWVKDTEKSKDATCTEKGYTFTKCDVCSEPSPFSAEHPALGHTEVIDQAVPSTCTKTGLTEGKHCSVCTAVIVAQNVVPMLDHTYVEVSRVEPSYVLPGSVTYKCACGATYTEDIPQYTLFSTTGLDNVPKTGNVFVEWLYALIFG